VPAAEAAARSGRELLEDGKVLAHGTSTLLVLPGAENR
jgi:hypothetical protein